MPSEQHRYFTFTQFKLDFDYKSVIDNGKLQYIFLGLEKCPKTERWHHQAWCYSKEKRTWKSVAKMLDNAHTEVMREDMAYNDEYCLKILRHLDKNTNPDKAPNPKSEYGKRPDGKRLDLTEAYAAVQAGASTADVVEASPALSMFRRQLEYIEDIKMDDNKRNSKTECEWIWGPTGVGKSQYVHDITQGKTVYTHPVEDKWWDAYKQQEIIWIDDFSGEIPIKQMLRLTDKYEMKLPRRNREPVQMASKMIYITSVKPPEHIYTSDQISQLRRRIKVIHMDVFAGPSLPPQVGAPLLPQSSFERERPVES
jgi:hypothetical protein